MNVWEVYADLKHRLSGFEPSRELSLAFTNLEQSEMWLARADTASTFVGPGQVRGASGAMYDRDRVIDTLMSNLGITREEAEKLVDHGSANDIRRGLGFPPYLDSTVRKKAIDMLIAEARLTRASAVRYIDVIEESDIALEMGLNLKAQVSEETLIRAAGALMEKTQISEHQAADIIRILNNAGIYLRDV